MKHLTRGSGLTAALLVIVLAALMLAVRGCAFPAAPAGEKQITISVIYADGAAEHFGISTRADCLKEAAEAVLTLEGEETAYGFTIYAVNGAEADFRKGEAYWAIYADGGYAQSSADRLPVLDGGTYAFIYERL